ncbi:MAG: sodium/solute symporter [Pirellulales bacterium]
MINYLIFAEAGIHTADYVTIVLYLLGVLALGAWFSRGTHDTESYILGGRSLPWWVIGVSYVVSLVSTVSIVSVPGHAYEHGVTLALSSLIGPFAAVGTFYLFIRFYFRGRMFTPFAYLESRFDFRVRALGAGLYLMARLGYLAIVLYSAAKVFESVSHWPLLWTILIVGIIGILYTVMGGMRAVVWTDFVQFVVLALGMAVIVAKTASVVPGGVGGVLSYAFENGRGMPELNDPSFFSFDPHVKTTLWFIIFFSISQQFFYNSSDQIAIQRLLSTSSFAQAKRSLFTSIAVDLPMMMVLWYLGLAMFSFYSLQPPGNQPDSGDMALFHFVAAQLPSPLPGLILSAMLAAVMSTLDSGINSLATVITKDFYLRFFRISASESEQVRFSRWMTLVVGLFAISMALVISRISASIQDTVMEAAAIWMALMNVLPPIFLLGVTSRRATGTHALLAAISGWTATGAMIVWYFVTKGTDHPVSWMAIGPVGFFVPLCIGFLLASLSKPLPADRLTGLTLWNRKAN